MTSSISLSIGLGQTAELIALAQSQKLESIYGAVTIGDGWRFGHLHVRHKSIAQAITRFTIPDDWAQVMGILHFVTVRSWPKSSWGLIVIF